MRRAVLMAFATMSLLGINAMADNFTFSFSVPAGTVTGEIFGLQNDGKSHPATEVLITSYPASLGPIQDLNATDWDNPFENSFTETNGVVTDAEYAATSEIDPRSPGLSLSESGSSLVTVGASNSTGATTFTPAPVPEPFSWFLLLTVMLAVAIVKRRRRTDGLVDPATQMRS